MCVQGTGEPFWRIFLHFQTSLVVFRDAFKLTTKEIYTTLVNLGTWSPIAVAVAHATVHGGHSDYDCWGLRLAPKWQKSLVYWNVKSPINKAILIKPSPESFSVIIRVIFTTHAHIGQNGPGLRSVFVHELNWTSLINRTASGPGDFLVECGTS